MKPLAPAAMPKGQAPLLVKTLRKGGASAERFGVRDSMDATCILFWAAVGKLMRCEERYPHVAAGRVQHLIGGKPCPGYVVSRANLSVCVKKQSDFARTGRFSGCPILEASPQNFVAPSLIVAGSDSEGSWPSGG